MGDPINSPIRDVRKTGNATVISLTGELDMHRAPAMREAMSSAITSRPPQLVVDFSDVNYIDSTGLGTLVFVLRKVKEYRGQMTLVAMSPMVKNVFEVTKLLSVFEIHNSVEEAIA
jgi:anti-sigma B factor antagonist